MSTPPAQGTGRGRRGVGEAEQEQFGLVRAPRDEGGEPLAQRVQGGGLRRVEPGALALLDAGEEVQQYGDGLESDAHGRRGEPEALQGPASVEVGPGAGAGAGEAADRRGRRDAVAGSFLEGAAAAHLPDEGEVRPVPGEGQARQVGGVRFEGGDVDAVAGRPRLLGGPAQFAHHLLVQARGQHAQPVAGTQDASRLLHVRTIGDQVQTCAAVGRAARQGLPVGLVQGNGGAGPAVGGAPVDPVGQVGPRCARGLGEGELADGAGVGRVGEGPYVAGPARGPGGEVDVLDGRSDRQLGGGPPEVEQRRRLCVVGAAVQHRASGHELPRLDVPARGGPDPVLHEAADAFLAQGRTGVGQHERGGTGLRAGPWCGARRGRRGGRSVGLRAVAYELRRVDEEAARGGELPEQDTAGGVGEHSGAQGHPRGELGPRGEGVPDLHQRGGHALREVLRAEDPQDVGHLLADRQPLEVGGRHTVDQAVQQGPVRFEVEAFHVQHAALVGLHQHRDPVRPGTLTGEDLDVEVVAFFDEQIGTAVAAVAGEERVDVVLGQALGPYRDVEIGIDLVHLPCGDDHFGQADVGDRGTQPVQVGEGEPVEVREAETAADPFLGEGERAGGAHGEAGHGDRPAGEAGLFRRCDLVLVAGLAQLAVLGPGQDVREPA
nr:hypothetical protein [Streptomyces sp. ISL-43]